MQEELLKAVATGGSMGVVLAGVLYFIGRRVLRMEEAVDRNTKVIIVLKISDPHFPVEAKTFLAEQLEEVQKAETRRLKSP